MFSGKIKNRIISNQLIDDLAIIQPSQAIAEVGKLPPDNLPIQTGEPLLQSTAHKLVSLLNDAKDKIIKVQATNCSYDTVTMYVPTFLATAILSLLQNVSLGCLNEVPLAVNELKTALTNENKSSQQVPFTRGLVTRLSNAYNELDQVDQNVNSATSLISTLAKPINTFDFSSVPNNNYLEDNLAIIGASTMSQSDLQSGLSSPLHQISLSSSLGVVLEKNPNAVGMVGTGANTNVSFDLSDEGEMLTLVPNLEKETEDGFKNLFSMKMLGVPLINLLTLLNVMPEWKTVTIGDEQVTVLAQTTIDVQDINTANSYVDQDVTVTLIKESKSTTLDVPSIYETTLKKASNEGAAILIHDVLKNEPLMSKAELQTLKYRGNTTGRVYTHAQLRSFSTTMASLWNKMKGISFPSVATIANATSVLSTGISMIGTLTGKKDIVKAATYLDMFKDGILAFKSATTRADEQTSTKIASIMLGTMPALALAGMTDLSDRGVINKAMLRTHADTYANSITAQSETNPDSKTKSNLVDRCRRVRLS